jgi:hypothetical protein
MMSSVGERGISIVAGAVEEVHRLHAVGRIPAVAVAGKKCIRRISMLQGVDAAGAVVGPLSGDEPGPRRAVVLVPVHRVELTVGEMGVRGDRADER